MCCLGEEHCTSQVLYPSDQAWEMFTCHPCLDQAGEVGWGLSFDFGASQQMLAGR